MEQEGLIDRIEKVKAKIAEFEKALNIDSIDIERISIDQNDPLISQISDYKKRIDNIEKDVLQTKKVDYPVEAEQLLTGSKTENAVPKMPFEKPLPKIQEIDHTLSRVKKDAQEVENISNMIDRLKDNISTMKPVAAQAPAEIKNTEKPAKADIITGTAVKTASEAYAPKAVAEKIQQQYRPQPAEAVKSPVNVTENDLHAMSELISKLDELLRSNKEISDRLGELIKEQKQSNVNSNNSRTTELINRLARLDANLQ